MHDPQINLSDILKHTPSKKAAKLALAKVQEYRSGTSVLRTPWEKVNKLLVGGFRFGLIYTIAGASGHGKSFFLNQLMSAFEDKELNGDFPHPFIWLHFSFEMGSADEVIRRASRDLNIPHQDILSLENKLSDEDLEKVTEYLNTYKTNVVYVEKAGTRDEILAKVADTKKKLKGYKVIVSVDHILLAKAMGRENDVEMMGDIVNSFVDVVDNDLMVILLGQLNAEIETDKRIQESELHTPRKRDIHGSKKVYHASDAVIVLHQPALLGIESYTTEQWATENTAFVHLIKYRHGVMGTTRLWCELQYGRFVDYSDDLLNDYLTQGDLSYEFNNNEE